MKIDISLGNKRAFSLIELMVVIAIIMMLAGLLIKALPGIQSKVNRNKVIAFLAELEGGLSKYQLDNGVYPRNDAGGNRDANGILGSTILYKSLSGDFNADGRVDDQEKIYVPRLDYQTNKTSKSPRSTAFKGSYVLLDSFGAPIRYLCDPPNLTAKQRKTINPTYDIWSIVDTDPVKSSDFSTQSKYITNWQSK